MHYLVGSILILLFTSLFAIPLARQRLFHAALFARLQVKGVTLHFLDDVLLLYFPLKAAQRIFERFAFLHTNFCQLNYTSKPAHQGLYRISGFAASSLRIKHWPGHFTILALSC